MGLTGLGLDALLAWRYLRGRQGFVSVISWISLVGMVLGTGVLIVVLSVMNGFERELRLRILGVVPHLLLYPADGQPFDEWRELVDRAAAQPGVAAASPWLSGTGMAIGRRSEGIYLRGIDPSSEAEISVIDEFLVEGSLEDLQPGQFEIILGDDLARVLAVEVGDSITLVVPRLSTSLAGIRPRIRRFKVVGLFAVGAEMDRQLGLLHLDDAAALLKFTGPQGVRLKLDDLFADADWQQQLADNLSEEAGGPLVPVPWTTSYGTLFAAVQLERQMVALLLSIIILIAAFNILASLVMAVDSRRGEIAILRTMGATRSRVVRIFLIQGLGIGSLGTLIGLGLGLVIAWQMEPLAAWLEEVVFQYSGRRMFDSYFVHYLPSQIVPSQIPLVGGAALGLSILAAIFPAIRAMRLQPAVVLRHN